MLLILLLLHFLPLLLSLLLPHPALSALLCRAQLPKYNNTCDDGFPEKSGAVHGSLTPPATSTTTDKLKVWNLSPGKTLWIPQLLEDAAKHSVQEQEEEVLLLLFPVH